MPSPYAHFQMMISICVICCASFARLCFVSYCLCSKSLYGVAADCLFFCTADGTWHGEFTDHQAHLMAQESHQGGSESDCMSSHMGHKPSINVPDFLPAMQKALYVRLSQKHQRDGDSVSSQGQRAMSKDEGKVNFVNVQNLLTDHILSWNKSVDLTFSSYCHS